MTPQRWRLVKAIVQAALARPAAARPAFVGEACGNDTALRAEVISLLTGPDTGEGSDGFLESPVVAGAIAAAVEGDFPSGAPSEGAPQSTGTAGAAHESYVTAAQTAALSAALAGRYDLERELGRGGMATIHLARDLRHGRRVAIKVLHPELGARVGPQRFRREIETAANLSHPHILPLFDSGRVPAGDPDVGGERAHGGLLYYVMPYVSGESLRARLRREGRLAVRDALRIVREVADALDYAHRHGVVHRDVKPENILLDEDGHALVADFGIARADRQDVEGPASVPAASPDSLTEGGRVIGTPAYMSPEQARGQPDLDGRSDEYSLACVAFEMLAGAAPFAGSSAEQLAERPTQAPPSLVAPRPDLPLAVHAAVARALALAPTARFATTTAFAEALAVSISGVPTRSVRPSWRSAAVSVAGLTAASALVAALSLRDRPTPNATPAPAGPPVLAVLPFENLGPPSDAYFADGLTDEVTGRLAAVSALRVIAGASMRQYKGSTKGPRAIARELGATHLLTGTVRWEHAADGAGGAAGTGRVRVRPELVRAADQETVWTEPVEGPIGEVLTLQTRVAERVVASLHVALLARERRAAAVPPNRVVAAYDAYLRALPAYLMWGGDLAGARRAASVRYRERQLALDPEELISHWNYMMCYLAWRADTAAARHVMERGGPAFEGMLVRGPNDGGMAALWHQVLGPAVWRVRDTLSFAGFAAGDAGLPPEFYLLMKLRHFALTGRPERVRAYADSAVAQLEPALRRVGDVTLYQTYSRRAILAEAYARLGRAADAGREIDRYLADVRTQRHPNDVPNALVNAAYVDVLAGRHDEAVARLAEALQLPAGIFISRTLLRADASWAPLRGHPGFERLLAGG